VLVLRSCYSMFLGFARSPVNFHAEDGSGYEFMGDSILKVRMGLGLLSAFAARSCMFQQLLHRQL